MREVASSRRLLLLRGLRLARGRGFRLCGRGGHAHMPLGFEPMFHFAAGGAALLLPKPVGEVTYAISLVKHCAGRSEQFSPFALSAPPDSLQPAPSSDQTWKLSPQPQRPFSFGLWNVKPLVRALTS